MKNQKIIFTHSSIIGSSKLSMGMKELIGMVAPSTGPVLVVGPTGAGKELVADEIHRHSLRKGKLVAVNCAAIPSDLMESELFGYEKGAFTGADKQRIGRFEQSHKGTLFLDEIGDMPLSLQSKLLRVLENHAIQRVGGKDDVVLDLRIVCATHKNLQSMVDSGTFRADLFYRLNVFPITVPSLKQRGDDVIELLTALSKKRQQKNPDFPPPNFLKDGLSELLAYDWPGNVRELRNVVERAFILFSGKDISGKNIRENLLILNVPNASSSIENDAMWEATNELTGHLEDETEISFLDTVPQPKDYKSWFQHKNSIDLRKHFQEIEVVLIEAALVKTDGKVSAAAELLSLGRTTLIEKMKKLMINKDFEL